MLRKPSLWAWIAGVAGVPTLLAGIVILAGGFDTNYTYGRWLVVAGSVLIIVGVIVALLLPDRGDHSDGQRNATAQGGSNANTGDAATINQVVGGQGHNFGTINNYAAPSPSVAVPVLEFGDPMFDDQVGIVDSGGNAHTGVRIWRVELRNIAEGTEATDVEVQIARSLPAVQTFPVDLHRFHDDNAPYAKRHNVRHGAPITFDVIAKAHGAAEVYFLWRSDLPQGQYTYIYQLSDPERTALLGNVRGEGAILILRAAGSAPVATKEKAYRLFIDGRGQFMMETIQPKVG